LDAKKVTKEDEMATCPGCQSGQLQKTEEQAKMGSAAIAKVVCNKCGLGFLQDKDRLKLIQLADGASIRLLKCLNSSFSLEQWKQIASGASLRYEAKSGSYVPDASLGNSETKPRHNPQLSEIRPSTIPYANEKTSVVDLMNNSRDSRNKSGISQEIEAKDQPNESKPTNYVLTNAGKYFLTMDFDRMMEINHLLRCVRDKIELEPHKLKILVDAGLLLDKK
jgi:hypothetical protein